MNPGVGVFEFDDRLVFVDWRTLRIAFAALPAVMDDAVGALREFEAFLSSQDLSRESANDRRYLDECEYSIQLSYLGIGGVIAFTEVSAYRQFSSILQALVADGWRSPDFVMKVDWREWRREFVRERVDGPPVLEGIQVASADRPELVTWSNRLPPFPPMASGSEGRFLRLHAAVIASRDGSTGILVVGDSGFGKTTIAVALSGLGNALLSDEDAFISLRTSIAHPFQLGHSLDSVGAQESARPVPISGIVQLGRSGIAISSPTESELFRLLLLAQRESGSSRRDSIVTIACLAKNANAAVVPGQDRQALKCLAKRMHSWLNAGVQRPLHAALQ